MSLEIWTNSYNYLCKYFNKQVLHRFKMVLSDLKRTEVKWLSKKKNCLEINLSLIRFGVEKKINQIIKALVKTWDEIMRSCVFFSSLCSQRTSMSKTTFLVIQPSIISHYFLVYTFPLSLAKYLLKVIHFIFMSKVM